MNLLLFVERVATSKIVCLEKLFEVLNVTIIIR